LNYQNIVCWGDSQTFGARTYGCYPLYLAQSLNRTTRYTWRVFNYSTNGHRARDLWFRMSTDLPQLHDVYIACILIGANDVSRQSPVDIFREYYRQSLDALILSGFRAVYCGQVPAIHADGHCFFPRSTEQLRSEYNTVIQTLCAEDPHLHYVEFTNLDAECYCDPVHFNEEGNVRVAEHFARAIAAY
jgi:lysophospholipase L1-like esterase